MTSHDCFLFVDKQIQVPPKGKDALGDWLSTVSDGVVPQEAKKVLREMLSTSDPTLINVVALIRQASIGKSPFEQN